MQIKNLAIRISDEGLKGRLISRLVSRYSYWLGGFYTEEMRSGKSREGFRLRTPGGRSEILASKSLRLPLSFRQYGVDPAALDGLAAVSIAEARAAGKIILIDELGPITLLSEKLAAAALEALASSSPCLAAFRRNAGAFEAAFGKMNDTLVLDADSGAEEALRARVDGWAENWIETLSGARP